MYKRQRAGNQDSPPHPPPLPNASGGHRSPKDISPAAPVLPLFGDEHSKRSSYRPLCGDHGCSGGTGGSSGAASPLQRMLRAGSTLIPPGPDYCPPGAHVRGANHLACDAAGPGPGGGRGEQDSCALKCLRSTCCFSPGPLTLPAPGTTVRAGQSGEEGSGWRRDW